MSGYEIRARRNRDGMGGGIMEYVRRGVICKRLKDFETTISESICSELLISKKKWFCICIYCPLNYNNLSTFFDENLLISKKKWFCMCIYCPLNYNNLSTFFDEITL